MPNFQDSESLSKICQLTLQASDPRSQLSALSLRGWGDLTPLRELSFVCPPHLIKVLHSGIKDLLVEIPVTNGLCQALS